MLSVLTKVIFVLHNEMSYMSEGNKIIVLVLLFRGECTYTKTLSYFDSFDIYYYVGSLRIEFKGNMAQPYLGLLTFKIRGNCCIFTSLHSF